MCVHPEHALTPDSCALLPAQFSQNKADGEVRWAVLNVAFLLRAREGLQDELAAAMQRGESVAACIQLIERRFDETV